MSFYVRHNSLLRVFLVLQWMQWVHCTTKFDPPTVHSVCPTGRPNGCTCHDTKNTSVPDLLSDLFYTAISEVNCTSVGLTSVPIDLPIANVIRLTGNNLGVLETVPARYAQSKTIDLASNNIVKIADGAFEHLFNVTNLFLHNNEISGLTPRTFVGLERLFYLDLCKNEQINEIKANVFSSQVLPHIGEIKLEDCSIYSIEDDAFSNSSSLLYIGLAGNKLSRIPAFSVSNPLFGLRTLKLEHNKIAHLGALTNMPRLAYLILAHNQLRHVAEGTFDAMARSLVQLDLSHNDISRIDAMAFTKLSQLQELNLDHNRLTTVTWEEFPWHYQLSVTSLHDNPWRCDCKNAYLVETEHDAIQLFNNNENSLRCASPKSVAGQKMSDVSTEHFVCRRDKHVQQSLTIALFVLTSLLLVAMGAVVFGRMRREKTNRHPELGVYTKFESHDSGIQYVKKFTI